MANDFVFIFARTLCEVVDIITSVGKCLVISESCAAARTGDAAAVNHLNPSSY